MPRDLNGTHNLPVGTLVTTGDTVLVSQHNPAMQDISQSLTNSLDRAGKGGMLANLPMNGKRVVNAAPGIDETDLATVGQTRSGALAIGLFSTAPSRAIPTGSDYIYTSGWGAAGQGAAGYVYSSSVDATYVAANPRTSFVSLNGRGFRLDPQQYLTIEMFGAVGDEPFSTNIFSGGPTGTDDFAAFDAAEQFSINLGTPPGTVGIAQTIHLGNKGYRSNQTLRPYGAARFKGVAAGTDTLTGSFIKFPANTAGVILDRFNKNPHSRSNDGALFEGIYFAGSGGTDKTKNGVEIHTPCVFRDCVTDYFPGTGWEVSGQISDSSQYNYGIADGVILDHCLTRACYIGFAIFGTDGNANTLIAPQVKSCTTIGILDISGLGNTIISPQVNECGVNHGVGQVYDSGSNWLLIARSSLNQQPSATPLFWLNQGPAAGPSVNYPAWSAATTYTGGLAIIIEGSSTRTTVVGGYTESGLCAGHLSTAIFLSGQYSCTPGTNHLFAAVGDAGAGVMSMSGVGGYRNYGGTQGYVQSKVGSAIGPSWYHQWIEAGGARHVLQYDFTSKSFTMVLNDLNSGSLRAAYNLSHYQTTYTYGRSAAVASTMAMSPAITSWDGNPVNGRFLYNATAAPTGDVATGEIVLNRAPTRSMGWACTSGSATTPTLLEAGELFLNGSATYDPPSLVDGAGVTTTVTATGAALGDFARASFGLDLQGITVTAWISAADTVSVRFQNESGGTIDLASGTLRVRVYKA